MKNINDSKDDDLTKEDLFECSSLIHSKTVELKSSLESLEIMIQRIEESCYENDRTLRLAIEFRKTQKKEYEKYSNLYKKIVNLYLTER